jgi:hypothetical protein
MRFGLSPKFSTPVEKTVENDQNQLRPLFQAQKTDLPRRQPWPLGENAPKLRDHWLK